MAMIVAIGTYELHLPDVHNLKAKRQVVRCICDRVKAKFNASIAEVDNNDLWQRATFGVSIVGNDRVFLQKIEQKIEEIISDHDQVEVLDRYWDYV